MNSPFNRQTHVDYAAELRREQTLDFIRTINLSGPFADVGERSWMTAELENRLHIKCAQIRCRDFDDTMQSWGGPPPYQFGTVFVLEVIEHLMNPLEFLRRLRPYLKRDGVLILSTPVRNPLGFWANREEHFTEYDLDKLGILLKAAGFRIASTRRWRSIPLWQGYRHGAGLIRGTLRLLTQETVIIHAERI